MTRKRLKKLARALGIKKVVAPRKAKPSLQGLCVWENDLNTQEQIEWGLTEKQAESINRLSVKMAELSF